MAMRPTCDVYGTAKGVRQYDIVVFDVTNTRRADPPILRDYEGHGDVVVRVHNVDLCPRALERTKAKIVAGTTPPVERKKKTDTADVAGQTTIPLEEKKKKGK